MVPVYDRGFAVQPFLRGIETGFQPVGGPVLPVGWARAPIARAGPAVNRLPESLGNVDGVRERSVVRRGVARLLSDGRLGSADASPEQRQQRQ